MIKANREERKTMTIPEAAKMLGISRNAAYQAAKRGELPVIRIGRLVLVSVPALQRMIEEGGGPPR